jgi:hypothetical protein
MVRRSTEIAFSATEPCRNNFGDVERIWVKQGEGGHFGGGDRPRDRLFKPGAEN